METKIKTLITALKEENRYRSNVINNGKCSEYTHTVLVHEYNLTLDFIKRLETL